MSDTVIRVENLGKRYIIGHNKTQPYSSLRDVIADGVRSVKSKFFRGFGKNIAVPNREEFWALKDVNFEIKRGDRVGIIGRNGAGKSTLLKILSRITEPTTGRVYINGKVASLLEVGTGFHAELTGRENIFLNGAILGMSKAEIRKRFDEIVAFAEVEKFLDTPVKFYSSGMYVRLAFAVAAHLEPEILIVDEVLAVGDAEFQKKCLGKMENVGKEGRTVLFVSHNMTTIQKLCSYGIYLKNGQVNDKGYIENVIDKYIGEQKQDLALTSLRNRKDRQGSGRIRVVDFYILDSNGERQNILKTGENYVFVMEFEKDELTLKISNVVGSIALTDSRNEIVFLIRSSFTNQNLSISKRHGKIESHINNFNIANGTYNSILYLAHGESEILDWIDPATEVRVEGGDFFGTGSMGAPSHCKVLTRAEWRVK